MALEELGWLLAIELEKKAKCDNNCVLPISLLAPGIWLFTQHLASSQKLSNHIYVKACSKRVDLFAST